MNHREKALGIKFYLSDVEAAEFISTSPQTLRNWRSAGKGPSYIKIGRLVRYRLDDLIKFMESGRIDL